MKKIFFWGACTLLTTMLFSCSADEDDSTAKIKKEAVPNYADGPGDGTVPPPPPPPEDE
ncbi:hypothetical protein [Flavobacterium foetidum]|uniref:hypothetical protein n=1 Tax=Flavobacterium foetidum TaxID=2026681 RepID=UPI0013C30B99|nr:hypothetical protein [Flavobacterium foetidum]